MDGGGLLDGLLVAVEFLVGQIHLDKRNIGNPGSDRADDVGSADLARLGLDGELIILHLAMDDGNGAPVAFVVIAELGETVVLEDHMTRSLPSFVARPFISRRGDCDSIFSASRSSLPESSATAAGDEPSLHAERPVGLASTPGPQF